MEGKCAKSDIEVPWFSGLNSGLQLPTTLFLFLVEPGPWCETRSCQVIWNICYWSWDIDLVCLRKKKHLRGYVSVTSLLLLFCPIGCSLLYFLRIIYCTSEDNLLHLSESKIWRFFSDILASKMWFWELWKKSWPNLSQHNDNNDTIYRKNCFKLVRKHLC